MDRNKENVDYTDGCMKCAGGTVDKARLLVGVYCIIAVILVALLARFHLAVRQCFLVYMPFIAWLQAEIERIRDQAKILLTYCQVCLVRRPA